MKQGYLIGIDVGTQSAKVVIFNLLGEQICEGHQPLRPLVIPAPQLAEHPDDDLWTSLSAACQKAMQQFRVLGLDEGAILGAGLCVIRCCRVLLKPDGELAWPVINWMDRRLNQPWQYHESYGDVRYITTTSGYITHRLIGEFKDTSANYIGWWPMDNQRQAWSEDAASWQRCNLTREQVFEVVKPGEILGTLIPLAAEATGLPAGLPIVATAHDKAVEALGSGSLRQGVCLVSLGTYIGAMVHGDSAQTEANNFWPFQASVPGKYLYECMGVRRGMWTVSWFRDQFGGAMAEPVSWGESIEALLSKEASQVPAGSEGLITLHDWAAPAEAEYRKGAFIGFDGRHTRAHMFRSLLEGIALTMKNHMDGMAEELGKPFTQIILSGGGANSDLMMQIFADVFGLPTQRNRMKSAAAIGCAINAGIAVGAFDSYQQASERLVQPAEAFQPNEENHRLYNAINQQVYRPMHDHLDPLLMRLSEITG